MEITIQAAYEEKEAVRSLFAEYTDMLVDQAPAFAGYLKQQNFDRELAHLEEKYGLPWGRLYLLRADGRPAGCIALKKLDETRCEMKRLYVRPAYRGRGLARMLVEKLLNEARGEGYEAMLLDTFPFLTSAIALYRAVGFREIPSYNNNPMEDLVYLEKNLNFT
ncbi:MAG: GNAT family N-acetyltransferase [Clostridiales bacterium]|nr:GNAT family N-acetyltransferase [Clostridiales bacterium]MDY4173011.1 GNAT family N-acetyltransferase [Evtepia sp.]